MCHGRHIWQHPLAVPAVQHASCVGRCIVLRKSLLLDDYTRLTTNLCLIAACSSETQQSFLIYEKKLKEWSQHLHTRRASGEADATPGNLRKKSALCFGGPHPPAAAAIR